MGYYFNACEAAREPGFAENLAMTITTELRGTPLLLIPQQRDLHSVYDRFACDSGHRRRGRTQPGALRRSQRPAPAHLHTRPDEVRPYLPPGVDTDKSRLAIAADRLHRPAEWGRLAEAIITWSSWRPDGHLFPLTVPMWDTFLNQA